MEKSGAHSENSSSHTRDFQGFPRISVNPEVMSGEPCIRGMRVTVAMILGNLGALATIDELIASYPYIEREDVLEAMRWGQARQNKSSCNTVTSDGCPW